MSNFNKVFLMGNLTRDVETRQAGGTTVAKIGLAVNRKFKGRDGTMQDETTFVDCEAWGKTADTMAQYLAKGRPVFIEGRLKLDQWEAKDGTRQNKLKVVVDSFQFVGGRDGGGERAEPTPPSGSAAGGYDDADIPF